MWLLLLVLGCGQSEPTPTEAESAHTPTDVEMVAAMEVHYDAAIAAHDAVIAGDLDKARASLSALSKASLPDGSPEAWAPLHEVMKRAAETGAEAKTVEAVGMAIAAVGQACGSCHGALNRGPVYPTPAEPGAAEVLTENMKTHQWGAERLWSGLTHPSDYAWGRGAAALSEASALGEEGAPELAEFVAVFSTVASASAKASGAGRAENYGKLLGTCASCHAAVGVKLVSKDAPPSPSAPLHK